jgi:methionyl-tRNA formyltransferase
LETVKAGQGFEALAGSEPDALAVVAYGEILPVAVLALPKVAPVNLHFSLLPELRGASPVQWAILAGLARTGVTTIRMDEGMDTGPILSQKEEEIRPEDDAGSLGGRLASLGGRILVSTLDRLEDGTLSERPQDDQAATYAPKLKSGDRVIAWGRPAEEIVRLVRAMAPEPGATTTFRGRGLKVLRASPAPAGSLGAGEVMLPAEDEGVVVATGDGGVRLEEVAPEGRRRISGAEFIRGYRPEAGEILGQG